MTLKNSQVERLFTYLNAEYQKKLQDLESTRIKEIEESDEYKTKLEDITNFLTNINYPLERIEYQSHALCNASFNLDESKYTHWQIWNALELKLKAIKIQMVIIYFHLNQVHQALEPVHNLLTTRM